MKLKPCRFCGTVPDVKVYENGSCSLDCTKGNGHHVRLEVSTFKELGEKWNSMMEDEDA